MGNGDGTFQAAQSFFAGNQPYSLVVGDFNGDGIPDVAVANYNDSVDGSVSVLLGKGDGTFQPALTFLAGLSCNYLAVGDFNGDGIPDLAVGIGLASEVHVLLGNGDGTFQTYPISYLAQAGCNSLAVGDFNGDGFLELAVVVGSGVSILTNDGKWAP